MGIKQVFVQALTEVSSTQKDDLGDIRRDGNMVYKYVKLRNTTATVAVVAQDTVVYGLAGYNDNLVVSDKSDAATKPIGAGQALAAIAGVLLTDYYVWVQIRGPATHAQDLAGVPTDGDALFAGGADKVLTLATAADDPVCAYADDDSADEVVCAFVE